MKIAIISDIHDNIVNLKKFLDWSGKKSVDKILCCGDVTNEDTLGFLSEKFFGEIFLVYGNVEIFGEDFAKSLKNVNCLGRTGVIELDGVIVGMCHQPFLIDEVIEKYSPQIIFYGHTHKPWIEDRSSIKVINPGTLGGNWYQATFAFWDTEKKDIKLINLDIT